MLLTILATFLLPVLLWILVRYIVAAPADTSDGCAIDPDDEPQLDEKAQWSPIDCEGLQECDVLATSAFVELVLGSIGANERWPMAAVSRTWREASRGGIWTVSAPCDVALLAKVLSDQSAEGLELVGRACKELPSGPLAELLRGLPRSCSTLRLARCLTLSDETLMAGGTQWEAPPLKELDISYTKVADDGLKALVPRRGRSLRRLLLAHSKVGDEGVSALAARCCTLEELDLSYLTRLTYLAGDFEDLVRASSRTLTSLDLSGLGFVDDDHLESVSALAQLTKLQLFGCKGVTPEGIRTLLGGVASLTSLNVGLLPALVPIGASRAPRPRLPTRRAAATICSLTHRGRRALARCCDAAPGDRDG